MSYKIQIGSANSPFSLFVYRPKFTLETCIPEIECQYDWIPIYKTEVEAANIRAKMAIKLIQLTVTYDIVVIHEWEEDAVCI